MTPSSAHALSALTDLSLYLPLFGLLVLFVVLFSLTLRRERWLLPGTLAGVVVSLFVFGLVEYQGRLHAALQPKPAPVGAQVPSPAQPSVPPAPEPVKEEPVQPEPPPAAAPKPERPKLIPVDPSKIGLAQPAREAGDLKTIREAPAPKPAPVAAPAPAPVTPSPAPSPKPEPVGARVPPPAQPSVPAAPPPKPAPPPQPIGPPAPGTAPASGLRLAVASPSANSGNLLVEIKGPLLEIVKSHQPNAHLLIVVDGKYRQVIKPTRIKQDRATTELGQAGPVTAINYFWENVSITFENLPAGPHSVMIDASLDDAGSHFSAMTGAESTKNDWNGFVDISPGQTATIVFGGKNWMSQQLDRLR